MVSSSWPRALSHKRPGLIWGCPTHVAAVQDGFPNLPQTWQLIKQLPKDNTQEKVKVSRLQAGLSHMTMEKRAPRAAPPPRCRAHPTSGARQMFSLPHQNCSSPKYSLQLTPAPHIAQDAAASLILHALIRFAKGIGEKYPHHSKDMGKGTAGFVWKILKSDEHHTLTN